MIREESVKLVCIITSRGICDKIMKDAGKFLNFAHLMLGHGTANSEVMAVLGLGEVEKDVLFAGVAGEKVSDLFKVLSEKFHFDQPGKGIAFTVSVDSTGGLVSLQILSGKKINAAKTPAARGE